MALNIPNVGQPGESLLKGFNTGSSMMSRIMQSIIQREQLAQQMKIHQDALAMQRATQGRAAQAAADAHKLAMMKLDPNHEINLFRRAYEAFGGKKPAQEQLQETGAQETPSYVPSIGGMAEDYNGHAGLGDEIPQLNTQAVNPFEAQHAPAGAQADDSGIDMDVIKNSPILRGYFKKHFGIDPGGDSNRPYQGAARNAVDLERLRKEVGEGSPVYQNAKNEYDATIQNKKDLDLMRNRTISGLKTGERWITDPQSGENIGIEHNLSEKERDREIGRTFFNELYPIVYKGASPFSGEGSIRKLEDIASKYNSDPQARKLFDDFMLAEKALTATTVNEAATIGAGKTNQTYKQFRESLEASDVPKKIRSLIKQYQIPASAQLRASMRFQKLINDAQNKANKMTPPTRKLYFNPELQAQEEEHLLSNNPVSEAAAVVIIDPSGKRFETTEENAAHLPKGWSRG